MSAFLDFDVVLFYICLRWADADIDDDDDYEMWIGEYNKHLLVM